MVTECRGVSSGEALQTVHSSRVASPDKQMTSEKNNKLRCYLCFPLPVAIK